MTCKWTAAWIGRCRVAADQGSDYCAKHTQKCSSCGETATHDCEETGQFVCGFPICDSCEHAIFPDGTNGGVGFNAQAISQEVKRHVKKSEQKYKPWYARAESGDPIR